MISRFDQAVDHLERAAVCLQQQIDAAAEAQHEPGRVRDTLIAHRRQLSATRDALLALAPDVPGANVHMTRMAATL